MVDERDEPSTLERDVLLASSGELPWWRRITLTRRLRRDARARRLAATLEGLEAALDRPRRPAPGSARPKRSRRIAIGSALVPALVVLAWFVLRWPAAESSDVTQAARLGRDASRRASADPAEDRGRSAPPEPDHVALARLVIASARIDRLPESSPPSARGRDWESTSLADPWDVDPIDELEASWRRR